ncbi:unnamed protein product [Amoebophrya sp. A25]|nr:unnamed protein product [Amoebophrya sp. A25]|eukprot:GSA25T00011006001.1
MDNKRKTRGFYFKFGMYDLAPLRYTRLCQSPRELLGWTTGFEFI